MRLLIRYHEKFIASDDIYSWIWAEVIPRKSNEIYVTQYKKIPREVARKIVGEEGLVCVARDSLMEIWDTPDRSFQRTWKKRIYVKGY